MKLARRHAPIVCTVLSLACSGADDTPDDNPGTNVPSGSCRVGVTFGGALDHQLLGGQDAACGSSFAGDTGVYTVFLPLDGGPVEGFSVDIPSIPEGETGIFSGLARIDLEDGGVWTTSIDGCSFDVVDHTFEEEDDDGVRIYTLGATGECEAATRDGHDDVTISGLVLRTGSYWF